MAKDLAELIVKVCIHIAEWFNDRKKKGDCSNDGKGTSKTK
jgi:hypothetical protein